MKNLVILGSHPRTRSEVDFDDPNLEIWAFNEVLVHKGFCKRADAIFQMHPKSVWNNPLNAGDKDNANWLKSGNTPTIWMIEKYPEVPQAKKYPFDEIRETLLPNFHLDSAKNRKDFYGSSVAYSTALGIYLGYQKIDWYGIELEQAEEYSFQVPSACFWAGIAIGRGVDFTAHSYLFDKPLYGIESFVTIDKQCFQDNIDKHRPRAEQLRAEYQELKKQYEDAFDKFKADQSLADEVEKLAIEMSAKAQAFSYADGAIQENERYLHRAEAMQQASGSYVFSRHEFARDRDSIMKERDKMILDFSQRGGMCREILKNLAREGIDPDLRQKWVEEFGKSVAEYDRLSQVVGMFTGGAQTDHELRERIPM